jgi:hypothetical protein
MRAPSPLSDKVWRLAERSIRNRSLRHDRIDNELVLLRQPLAVVASRALDEPRLDRAIFQRPVAFRWDSPGEEFGSKDSMCIFRKL